jgi:hypothetical protein
LEGRLEVYWRRVHIKGGPNSMSNDNNAESL